MRTIGGHEQACTHGDGAARLIYDRETDRLGCQREILDVRRCLQGELRRLAQPAPERCANAAIGSDVAEVLDALLRGVEARKSEASCFRDMNGADGRRLGRNAAPRVQAFKYPPAHITERGGALIEARLS